MTFLSLLLISFSVKGLLQCRIESDVQFIAERSAFVYKLKKVQDTNQIWRYWKYTNQV